jgi:hypothetical protein
VQLEKQRLGFLQSAENKTRIKITTITSQRNAVGRAFHIDNLEVNTIGG